MITDLPRTPSDKRSSQRSNLAGLCCTKQCGSFWGLLLYGRARLDLFAILNLKMGGKRETISLITEGYREI